MLAGSLLILGVLLHGGVVPGFAVEWLENLAWTAFSLLAGLRCLRTARSLAGGEKRAWRLYGAAALSWFAGMVWLMALQVTQSDFVPVPTPANFLFMGFAPLFVLGVLYDRSERRRRQVDIEQVANLGLFASGITVIAIIVLLQPLTAAQASPLLVFFSILDPVAFATATAFAITNWLFYRLGRDRRVFTWLLFSVAIHTAADLVYFADVLGYGSRFELQLIWLIAFSFQYWAAAEKEEQEESGAAAPPVDSGRLALFEAIIPAVLLLAIFVVQFAFRRNLSATTLQAAAAPAALFVAILAVREWWLQLVETSSKTRLKDLSRRLLVAHEAERRKIARELHDEVGQLLVVAKLELSNAERQNGASVDAAIQHLDEVMEQVRGVSHGLRPPTLDDFGLVRALRWLVEERTPRAGVVVTFESDLERLEVPDEVAISCFRVAQEAITNALRHSGAARIRTLLERRRRGLLLEVSDDGRGFDADPEPGSTQTPAGVGLLSMRERTRLVGGTFEIASSGSGTRVRAFFPLEEAAG